jgi:hypothetical protein
MNFLLQRAKAIVAFFAPYIAAAVVIVFYRYMDWGWPSFWVLTTAISLFGSAAVHTTPNKPLMEDSNGRRKELRYARRAGGGSRKQ